MPLRGEPDQTDPAQRLREHHPGEAAQQTGPSGGCGPGAAPRAGGGTSRGRGCGCGRCGQVGLLRLHGAKEKGGGPASDWHYHSDDGSGRRGTVRRAVTQAAGASDGADSDTVSLGGPRPAGDSVTSDVTVTQWPGPVADRRPGPSRRRAFALSESSLSRTRRMTRVMIRIIRC